MGRRCSILVKIVFSMFVACIYIRCTPTTPQFEEMVGTWKAKDGATIELNADSSFVIKNFNPYFFHGLNGDKIQSKVDVIGRWRVQNEYLGYLPLGIYIDVVVKSGDSYDQKEEWLMNKYAEIFYIKGDGGIFTDKAPWFIRVIDNFDNYETYDFKRVE